ncbi:MAG: ATP-binding protein [Prevotellaceae bacterium]|jgi:predicted AAA+ superfamily ATPase|nr:ATP-binding protein [Prevotellaceae bacterium]
MILDTTIEQVAASQYDVFIKKSAGLRRSDTENLPALSSHALIISGIRRCGKSTLLCQLLDSKYPDAFFLNFEDPRLYGFERNDFSRLDSIIAKSQKRILMLDEIQIVPEWERYVRQKLDEDYHLIITGSNASLLSRELGTKLTGRYLMHELFPFSYEEFCAFRTLEYSPESVSQYLLMGGFPEYLKQKNEEVLSRLFDDILMRDIVVRYGVRDMKTLQRLALYLVSNVGNLITGNKLKRLFEAGATSTVLEYLSHLEMSYLLFFVPKFTYSLKQQALNPRKVYAIDTGFINVNSDSFTDDTGHKFENLVFLHLRRKYSDIFYFSEKSECDFIVCKRGKIKTCVQVCYELTQDNMDREIRGLFEALEYFNLAEGILVTLRQTDRITRNNRIVTILPAHVFLNRF